MAKSQYTKINEKWKDFRLNEAKVDFDIDVNGVNFSFNKGSKKVVLQQGSDTIGMTINDLRRMVQFAKQNKAF